MMTNSWECDAIKRGADDLDDLVTLILLMHSHGQGAETCGKPQRPVETFGETMMAMMNSVMVGRSRRS